jgi:hypothetical protein
MRQIPARTVAVIGAVCVTVGWLLASTLTPPVAQSQSLPERAEKPSLPPAESTFAEHLHFRMQQAPAPPAPRRNPFSFGQAPRPAAASPERSEPVTEVAPSPSSAPQPGLRFSLSGIGVTGESRTAVLAEGQKVHIVKPGDVVDGFTVVAITDDSVTVAASSGLQHVLRLR